MLFVVCYTDTIYYVVIRIFGASDLVTGKPLGLLRNVTDVLLISELDDNETRLSASEVLPLNQYTVKTKLPKSGNYIEFAFDANILVEMNRSSKLIQQVINQKYRPCRWLRRHNPLSCTEPISAYVRNVYYVSLTIFRSSLLPWVLPPP